MLDYKPLLTHIPCESCLKFLDVEFGRLQARDMLQHLSTGPISNASVDVIKGSRSVEVRASGVTKVAVCYTKFSSAYLEPFYV